MRATPCPHCFKSNWFGIDNLRTTVTCERCLKSFGFPQGSLNFERTPWQYRVVGPYSVPNYAEGAYATVLALNVFARGLGGDHANVTYATGLNFRFGEDLPFEVDFSLWYQRRRLLEVPEEPVLVFGESKCFAVDSFKTADLDRMRKLSEMFPGAFLAFVTLKDELSDNERLEIGRLAMWGRERLPDGRPRSPVIVITGTEAFAEWNIEHTWKGLSDRRAQFAIQYGSRLENLWNFATITQQIYLSLPDPFRPPLPPGSNEPPESPTDEVEGGTKARSGRDSTN